VVDASEEFYNAVTEINKGGEKVKTKKLNETIDPEEKRKIIGDTFMHVAQREITDLGLSIENVYLGKVLELFASY